MTNAMTAKSLTEGAHHIGLAVRDVAEARDFFVNSLGFALAADRPDYPAIFVSDGTPPLNLWQVHRHSGVEGQGVCASLNIGGGRIVNYNINSDTTTKYMEIASC